MRAGNCGRLAREERPAVVLKAWEQHDLLEAVNPNLAKRHPDYDAITRLMKVREDLFTAGFRPRLATPMLLAILGRLKDREQSGVLSKAGLPVGGSGQGVSVLQKRRWTRKRNLIGQAK